MLLDADVAVDLVINNGTAALTAAAGHVEAVCLLLHAGADANLADDKGITSAIWLPPNAGCSRGWPGWQLILIPAAF